MIINFFVLVFVVNVSAGSSIEGFVQSWAYDYDLYENVLDPELCQQQLRQMDAFEFYDASFRIPQSILRGNMFSLGNYHQCLAINQPRREGSIRGKYCIIQTQSMQIPILTGNAWPANVTWADLKNVWSEHNLKTYYSAQKELAVLSNEPNFRTSIIDVGTPPLTLAICLPRSCRVEDVFNPLISNDDFGFNYSQQFCRLPDDKPYSGADIAAALIFFIIGCLTLISTAYELNHIFIKKEISKPDEIWSCFSVYGNMDRLLTLGSRPGALDCLDGIRSLSILWVILGHSFLVHLGTYLSNGLDLVEWLVKLRAVFLTAANVSVDSFFFLSGLLLVYTTSNKLKQMQLLKNLHLFYLNRLLRMFPLLASAVLLQASALHQVADGVRWNHVAWETQKCRDHWWSALLHVQNIVNPREICLSHSWYLSVDVQLHILSPLLLFWVLGSRRSAWTGLATAILGSITFVTIYSFLMGFTGEHNTEYTVYFYHNTLARCPVFLIGMMCGYLLHLSRGRQLIMPLWKVSLGHVLALALFWYSVYQVHVDWSSQLWITFNVALFRSAWAVALCWLVVVCVHGYAGPINWFLSLKLFKFLGRISYAMYIFHYPMQFVTVGANIMPIYFSMEGIFVNFASDVAYTVIVSIAACVLLDAPCSTLIRRLMMAIAPQKASNKQPKQQEVIDQIPESKASAACDAETVQKSAAGDQ